MALEWSGKPEESEEAYFKSTPDPIVWPVIEISQYQKEFINELAGYQWSYNPVPPQKSNLVTIELSQGNVKETLQIKPDELLPKNRYKLHQKIDALIEKAYKKK